MEFDNDLYLAFLKNFMSPTPTLPADQVPVAGYEYVKAMAEMANAHAPTYNLSLTAVSSLSPEMIAYYFSQLTPVQGPTQSTVTEQVSASIGFGDPVMIVAPVQHYMHDMQYAY